MPPSEPIRIGLLVFPDCSLMALASAIEPLRAANRLAGRPIYVWQLLSAESEGVSTSCGVALQTLAIDGYDNHGQDGHDAHATPPPPDRLFVVASLNTDTLHDVRVNRYLQRLAARGVTLGALSTGTFVLARAGVLAGYQCTLHWEALRQFAEEFPTLSVCSELYVRDRNRWTCAGGTAAIVRTIHARAHPWRARAPAHGDSMALRCQRRAHDGGDCLHGRKPRTPGRD